MIMSRAENVVGGAINIPLTDESCEQKKILKILKNEYNFICRGAIDKSKFASLFEIKNSDKDETLADKISIATKNLKVFDKII